MHSNLEMWHQQENVIHISLDCANSTTCGQIWECLQEIQYSWKTRLRWFGCSCLSICISASLYLSVGVCSVHILFHFTDLSPSNVTRTVTRAYFTGNTYLTCNGEIASKILKSTFSWTFAQYTDMGVSYLSMPVCWFKNCALHGIYGVWIVANWQRLYCEDSME